MTTTPASRNAALLRAGVAVAAAIALLVGALALEEKRAPEAAATAAVAPAAKPATPEVAPVPPQAAAPAPVAPPPAVAEAPAVKAAPENPAPIAAPSPASPEPTPAIAVVAPQMPTPPVVVPPTVGAVEPPPVARLEPRAAAPAPQALPHFPASAAMPAKDGYLLQLGVFGNPANAGTLQAELAAKGLPARVESRVVLGPFPDRKALDAAQRRLKQEKRMEGVVVPPRNGR